MDEAPVLVWEERRQRAMGAPATIIVGGAPAGALDWATDELFRLEQCWSRFLPDSELQELNASTGRWFPMSPTLSIAVERALDAHWFTSGLFDPSVHDRLCDLGYDRTFRQVPATDDTPLPTGTVPGIGGVELVGRDIRLPEGVRLDLGGIGKGLAADLLATGLIERGAAAACVSLGGDIRAAGLTPEPTGWQVPIQDPLSPSESWGTVGIADSAIVTSTTLIRTWQRAGRNLHHLIDPRTAEPSAGGVVAAVVHASEAWRAEAVAKAAVIADLSFGIDLINAAGVAGWLVDASGAVVATQGAPTISRTKASS